MMRWHTKRNKQTNTHTNRRETVSSHTQKVSETQTDECVKQIAKNRKS